MSLSELNVPNLMMEESAVWLADFERKNGRKLRVLHIGNIANNAYNNARIQQQRGIDAYVMSFDYYHIMATPEWEDADFEGDVGDPFMPDWHGVELNGFNRPRWFVAGPLDLSIRYILAEMGGKPAAQKLWQVLEMERWLLCRKSLGARLVRILLRLFFPPGQINVYVPAYAAIATRIGRIMGLIGRLGGRLSLRWRSTTARLKRHAAYAKPLEGRGRRNLLRKKLLPAYFAMADDSRAKSGEPTVPDLRFLITRMRLWSHPFLPYLLRQFDVVQCYGNYTAMPYLLGRDGHDGKTGYVAYEHGTIRSLPFEDSEEGRLCAASYRAAARVCVTNTDNLIATHRLGIDQSKVIALPHAFDDVKLTEFAKYADIMTADKTGRVTFFTPTRQDWTRSDPGLNKGNDSVFHALQRIKLRGHNPILIAVEWGQDVAASKALIAELDIVDMVQWVPPMKKKALWKTYLASHAVIDQFSSPALGGVSFETMILGRRLITHLDREVNRSFFGEEPPLFYAESMDQITTAMEAVLSDPDDKAGHGAAATTWMRKYHSADRITALQLVQYRKLQV